MEVNKKEEATINVLGIEEKTSPTGKVYYMFNTTLGPMSCWNKILVEDAKKLTPDDLVNVAYTEKDGFKNLKSLGPLIKKERITAQNGSNQATDKFSTMYVSYAKDLFIAMREKRPETDRELMGICCQLVSQANAFFSS